MALFAICANVDFGASVVVMNAYLPALASASLEVMQAQINLDGMSSFANVCSSEDGADSSSAVPLLGTPSFLKGED